LVVIGFVVTTIAVVLVHAVVANECGRARRRGE